MANNTQSTPVDVVGSYGWRERYNAATAQWVATGDQSLLLWILRSYGSTLYVKAFKARQR